MYSKYPSTVYCFHGCDLNTKDRILHHGDFFSASSNTYDWLGSGIYFWEGDAQRAYEFANDVLAHPSQSKGSIFSPAVIGAVVDLGHCCELSNRNNIELLKHANEYYLESLGPEEPPLMNKGALPDMKGRYRDCAVINALHSLIDKSDVLQPFDTVRSVFFEGGEIYSTSAFREFTHIQVCVRNPNCIKAIFDPREPDVKYRIP